MAGSTSLEESNSNRGMRLPAPLVIVILLVLVFQGAMTMRMMLGSSSAVADQQVAAAQLRSTIADLAGTVSGLQQRLVQHEAASASENQQHRLRGADAPTATDLEQLQRQTADLAGKLERLAEVAAAKPSGASSSDKDGAVAAAAAHGVTVEQVHSLRMQLRQAEQELVELKDSVQLLLNDRETRVGGAVAKKPIAAQTAVMPPAGTVIPDSSISSCKVPTLKYQDFWQAPLKTCKIRSNLKLQYQQLSPTYAPAELIHNCSNSLTATDLEFAKSDKPSHRMGFIAKKCGDSVDYAVAPMFNQTAYERVKSMAVHRQGSLTAPVIVVLVMDAMSRAQFMRALPQTMATLRDINEQGRHRLIDYLRYSVIGAYSPPNRYAMFSGIPPKFADTHFEGSPFLQFKEFTGKNHAKVQHKDLWMWEVLSKMGYLTYSTRDMCSKMADHVYDDFVSRPWTDIHFQDLYCDMKDHTAASSFTRCLHGQLAHTYSLQSASLFLDTYSSVPRFVYIDLIEGHESTMRVSRTIDEGVADFLRLVTGRPNVLVAITSDHGIGDMGRVDTVRIEERLPVLMWLVPQGLLPPEDLAAAEKNAHRLFSPMDFFETVVTSARRQLGMDKQVRTRQWAMDMFSDAPDRNCKEAGIGLHACPCDTWDDAGSPSPRKWR